MRRVIFEPDHDDYRQAIRECLERVVVPHYEQWERDGIVPRSLFTNLGELGVFGSACPSITAARASATSGSTWS
jgi:acyl-CoA dehydrogenase